jgi:hypothetical protein
MARIARRPHLTLAELEQMLNERRAQLGVLARERDQLRGHLAAIDGKLRAIAGGASTGAILTRGGRARNSLSLVATLSNVLSEAKQPLNVGDIVEKVQAHGYRSTAANFRALVNQTLIKQRKLFANTGRGFYQFKQGKSLKLET